MLDSFVIVGEHCFLLRSSHQTRTSIFQRSTFRLGEVAEGYQGMSDREFGLSHAHGYLRPKVSIKCAGDGRDGAVMVELQVLNIVVQNLMDRDAA